MKNLVFDTSSVITLVTNNLLDLLMPLKSKFKGDFFILGKLSGFFVTF